jgi:S-adenosylmethionine hydrolase
MARLRLYHSSTPARIYEIKKWNEFEHHGEVRIWFTFNGEFKDFRIGYTKPYLKEKEGVFANVINLNQFGSKVSKIEFKEWQRPITNNGTIEIDIYDFRYEVISTKNKTFFQRLFEKIRYIINL